METMWTNTTDLINKSVESSTRTMLSKTTSGMNGVISGFENILDNVVKNVNKLIRSINESLGGFIQNIPTIEFIPKFGRVSVPQYSTGGFPEDGLFMANHTELVGQFTNGKTAVANNEMIVAGIEEAAYRGFTRHNGDCYVYYACCKMLLDIAGIENMRVDRYPRYNGNIHYWLLVKLNGEWYHCDATEGYNDHPGIWFMCTDDQINDRYHQFNGSLYPMRAGGSKDYLPSPTPTETTTPTPSESPTPSVNPNASTTPTPTATVTTAPVDTSTPTPTASTTTAPVDTTTPEPTADPTITQAPETTTDPGTTTDP